ncbi:HIT family protein [Candidatus Woesearchaeota archaeon]|nr:HIT family protein [Candidatus Woesearchaeota archaeon]
MQMTDCIFCKIIKGDIPCSKVYEDEDFLAFLDIGPVNKGHTLIIPKEHHETLLDTPDYIMERIGPIIRKVAAAVKSVTGADGLNVMQSNNASAGQIVPHLHFHLIPRFQKDGFKHWPQGQYKEGEMEEYRTKIAKLL